MGVLACVVGQPEDPKDLGEQGLCQIPSRLNWYEFTMDSTEGIVGTKLLIYSLLHFLNILLCLL
jgi:hypothetical protein